MTYQKKRKKFHKFLSNNIIFSFLVMGLVLVFVQVDGQLGHGPCNVLGPDLNLVKVLAVIQVRSTNIPGNLVKMHAIHVEALGWRHVDPLHGSIQSRGAVDVLEGVPSHPPLPEGGNPVVVVAGVLLDVVVVVHLCRKEKKNMEQVVEYIVLYFLHVLMEKISFYINALHNGHW